MCEQRDRSEFEITPSMIEAGVGVLREKTLGESLSDSVTAVLIAATVQAGYEVTLAADSSISRSR